MHVENARLLRFFLSKNCWLLKWNALGVHIHVSNPPIFSCYGQRKWIIVCSKWSPYLLMGTNLSFSVFLHKMRVTRFFGSRMYLSFCFKRKKKVQNSHTSAIGEDLSETTSTFVIFSSHILSGTHLLVTWQNLWWCQKVVLSCYSWFFP